MRLASTEDGTDRSAADLGNEKLVFYSPLWSPDGSKIAFSAKDRQREAGSQIINYVFVTDPETASAKEIYRSEDFVRLLGWSPDGGSVVIAEADKFGSLVPRVEIGRVDLAAGEKILLSTLENAYYYNIRLSPDGRSIAFAARLENKDDIWVRGLEGENSRRLTRNNDPQLFFSNLSWSPRGDLIVFGKQSRFTIISAITEF